MLGHSGKKYVLAYLRQRYWLIHGNSMVRKVLADCWDCKRRQGKVGEQKMADLPEDRVNPGEPPFSCVGVDYFGPFFVREKKKFVQKIWCYFHLFSYSSHTFGNRTNTGHQLVYFSPKKIHFPSRTGERNPLRQWNQPRRW